MTLEGEEGHKEGSVQDPSLDVATEQLLEKEKQAKSEGKELSDVEKQKLQEHRERSDLGRRFKEYRDANDSRFSELSSKFDTLIETLQGQKTIQGKEADTPRYVATDEDVEQVLERREKKKLQNQQVYEQNYAKTVMAMGKNNEEDIHEEVAKELLENINSPFNRIHTGNPIIDAQMNYEKATNAVLRKRTAQLKGKPNVKGTKTEVSTDLSVSTGQEVSVGKGIELDDFSKSYLRSVGATEDWGKKVLSGK